ncbi:MAG: capsular polysaccharide biosynthesis protein [Clostridia bacterium]|nr:capsular polysaccharide biosynthesis protein [Clostridia bacterium]
MIDWHSHILPKMDDGSRDVSESIALLTMQAEQGVDTVIATPHFYANDETVESFLKRRKESFERLQEALLEGMPKIILGAEVRYYRGISRLSELKSLRVEGSKLLLLEMPESKWTEDVVRELVEMSSMSKVRLVLAHIERYFDLQSPAVWNRLYESGIMMQVNASFFDSFSTKRKALSWVKKGKIHFIGSDCHNLTTRKPKIGNAFAAIEKKLGVDYLVALNEYGYSKLGTQIMV